MSVILSSSRYQHGHCLPPCSSSGKLFGPVKTRKRSNTDSSIIDTHLLSILKYSSDDVVYYHDLYEVPIFQLVYFKGGSVVYVSYLYVDVYITLDIYTQQYLYNYESTRINFNSTTYMKLESPLITGYFGGHFLLEGRSLRLLHFNSMPLFNCTDIFKYIKLTYRNLRFINTNMYHRLNYLKVAKRSDWTAPQFGDILNMGFNSNSSREYHIREGREKDAYMFQLYNYALFSNKCEYFC